MNKTIIFIIILFYIANMHSSEKNENIRLPKIPIYIDGDYSNFEDSYFKEVNSENDAFLSLYIIKNKTIKKYWNFKRSLYVPGYGLTGWVIGYDIDRGNAKCVACAPGGADTYDDVKNTAKIIGSVLGLAIGILLVYNEKPISLEQEYKLSLFEKDKLIKSSKQRVEQNSNVSNLQLEYFLNSVNYKNINKYKELNLLIMKYNEVPTNNIYGENINKLEKLYKPKDEFETTQQYNERIEKDKIIENEIMAKYKQSIMIAKEQDEINKFKLLKEIKEEIKNIEFTKSYDFQISNYDADKQSFTFNISGDAKKVVVPQVKAPKFKENVSDYVVQKTFKPTLNGSWETVSDDYTLINTKTNDIIDWEGSIPTYVEKAVENPPILSASVKLTEPSGEGYLDAEETAIIQVNLKNSGKGSAKRTRISLLQQEGPTLYYDVSKTIEKIEPGQSITAEFTINVPTNINDGNVEFKISFLEEQGFEPPPLTFSAETRAMQNPELIIVDFGIDDANGDGKISKGESADITLRLQNIGPGDAKNVTVTISVNSLDNIFITSNNNFDLDNLISGESKDVLFTISTNKRVNEIVTVQVNITEKRPQFSVEDKINLEIEKAQKQLVPIYFKGSDEKEDISVAEDLSIDIEHNIPIAKKKDNNAIAIIFGIENYRSVSDVNYAFRDATVMKEYFSKTIGIPDEQIYFKSNDEVTLGEFRKIFSVDGWLDKRVIENKTDVYFYYAGHGAPAIKEEKAFLIPFDGDPNYPVQTGYSLEAVFDNLSKFNANSVTVFLDACFTGVNRENEMLLADARPVSIQLKNNYVNNVTVFSATMSNEISSSYPQKNHGLFSYFLMKGMQGDADSNHDNQLSIKELFDYTKINVSRTAGTLDREQTPQLECLEPEKILINY